MQCNLTLVLRLIVYSTNHQKFTELPQDFDRCNKWRCCRLGLHPTIQFRFSLCFNTFNLFDIKYEAGTEKVAK
jgi:hypothetical protein